jgi:NhaP-type Na+/H+ or K+/H+ antiporter
MGADFSAPPFYNMITNQEKILIADLLCLLFEAIIGGVLVSTIFPAIPFQIACIIGAVVIELFNSLILII